MSPVRLIDLAEVILDQRPLPGLPHGFEAVADPIDPIEHVQG